MQEATAGTVETDAPTHKKVKLTTTDLEAVDQNDVPCNTPCVGVVDVAEAGVVADAAAACRAARPFPQQAQLPAWLPTASSAETHMPQCLVQQLQAGEYSTLDNATIFGMAGKSIPIACGAPCSTATFDANDHADSAAPQPPQCFPVTALMHGKDQACDTGSSEQGSGSKYDPMVPHVWADSAPQDDFAIVSGCSTAVVPVCTPLDKQSVATAQDLNLVVEGSVAGHCTKSACQGNLREKLSDMQQEASSAPSKRSR